MKKIDFLAIGDIVVDAFIELKDADVHCKIDSQSCELCVRFGDKIPYEKVVVVPAVGNSPNAAVAAARLGLKSALVTALGQDKNGRESLEVLKKEKIDTSFVSIESKPTNYHYVLRYGAERTILTKHADFHYQSLKNLPSVSWIYLSSLGPSVKSFFYKEISNYLKKHKETKLAFQPGTYQIKLGYQKLKYFYERAEVFICNKEEAQRILETSENDIKKLLQRLKNLGPEITVITNGPKGAYAFDGKKTWFTPMYPDKKPPVDRTGAGDAFSATFVAALCSNKSIPEALQLAPINSMSVVQYIGAREGLLTKKQLFHYLTKAPKSYKVKEI